MLQDLAGMQQAQEETRLREEAGGKREKAMQH